MLTFVAKQAVDDAPWFVIMESFYLLLQFGGYGISVGWINRKPSAAEDLSGWVEKAGFSVDRCVVEPVDEMPMDAIYLEGPAR